MHRLLTRPGLAGLLALALLSGSACQSTQPDAPSADADTTMAQAPDADSDASPFPPGTPSPGSAYAMLRLDACEGPSTCSATVTTVHAMGAGAPALAAGRALTLRFRPDAVRPDGTPLAELAGTEQAIPAAVRHVTGDAPNVWSVVQLY